MPRMTRRSVLKAGAAAFAAPFVWRHHAHAAPSETVLHASFGADGMAGADINSLSQSKNLKLVAVAEVDSNRKNLAALKKRWPDLHVYDDFRVLLDKEKHLDSVNVSTPDHMHAPIAMRAMNRGLNVYSQKPLTQTIYEARRLTEVAAEKKLVTQMGIQIHSASGPQARRATHSRWRDRQGEGGPYLERQVVGRYQAQARPHRPGAQGFDWDLWLGVAAERPFIGNGYYHPGNWRKRLDFGTGTFGDMGCHILDPVFGALGVGNPLSIRSELPGPNADNWSLDVRGEVHLPRHEVHDRDREPDVVQRQGAAARGDSEADRRHKLNDQGSIYIGTEGRDVLAVHRHCRSCCRPRSSRSTRCPRCKDDDHYLQFVEAVRGNGKTSAPFSYSGPLTELVLLGCLATRFEKQDLKWDTKALKFTNNEAANQFVRKTYRKGFEVEGLSQGI